MLKNKQKENLAGFSLKTLLITAIGILIFGIYVGVLMFGENSLTVWTALKEKRKNLSIERKVLKTKNQKLQKKYFELEQLQE